MLSGAKHLWLTLGATQADDQGFFASLRMTGRVRLTSSRASSGPLRWSCLVPRRVRDDDL